MRALTASHPLQLLLGLGIWAIWFLAVYGGLSVACSAAPPATARGVFSGINAVLLACTIATAAGLTWAAFACARAARRIGQAGDDGLRRFIAASASTLHAIAAISTLFVGLPLLFLWPCV